MTQRIQTRRSVKIKEDTYLRLKEIAAKTSTSLSEFVETLVRESWGSPLPQDEQKFLIAMETRRKNREVLARKRNQKEELDSFEQTYIPPIMLF